MISAAEKIADICQNFEIITASQKSSANRPRTSAEKARDEKATGAIVSAGLSLLEGFLTDIHDIAEAVKANT